MNITGRILLHYVKLSDKLLNVHCQLITFDYTIIIIVDFLVYYAILSYC